MAEPPFLSDPVDLTYVTTLGEAEVVQELLRASSINSGWQRTMTGTSSRRPERSSGRRLRVSTPAMFR